MENHCKSPPYRQSTGHKTPAGGGKGTEATFQGRHACGLDNALQTFNTVAMHQPIGEFPERHGKPLPHLQLTRRKLRML